MMSQLTVGVIGSGTMGSGIAQVAATAGCKVFLYDTDRQALDKSRASLDKILSRLVEKGKVSEDKKAEIQSNITTVSALEEMSSPDLVIEAIIEDLDIKKAVFSKLETLVGERCVLASNTSSLSITSIAAALEKPERFIGIHFFNPAPLMKLVEVIPALQTSEETLRNTRKLIDGWSKLTVVAKDTPGFIVNKVARPFYGESLRVYEEGVADFATIDWAIKTFGGFRMGPFELMDFIGNDINYTVTETVFKAFYYDPRYKPTFTQKRLSEAGYLGRKRGRGYYDYGENAVQPKPNEEEGLGKNILNRVLVMLINEAADTLHIGIATRDDIDTAMTTGVNYPKGLLKWADEMGVQRCVDALDELYGTYHEDRYRCSVLLRNLAKNNQSFYE